MGKNPSKFKGKKLPVERSVGIEWNFVKVDWTGKENSPEGWTMFCRLKLNGNMPVVLEDHRYSWGMNLENANSKSKIENSRLDFTRPIHGVF